MSQEDIQTKETTLERKDKPEVGSLEQDENSQEFANKILGKIEEDFKSIPSNKEEIEKVENSISLENQSTKGEIKSELDLDNKLGTLDTEATIVKEETKSKISEISGFSKAYHHPEYRKDVAKQILEARKSGSDAEEIRTKFYEKTGGEKENFESQEKERSIAEIMKEKDLVVVHGIPFIQGNGGSDFNNRAVDKNKLSFEDNYKIILGLEPTISTSIPSPDRENNGLYYPAGVILGEGKILSARAEDSGSVAYGLYKRIPKYGDGEKHTAIQSKIDIEKTQKRASESGYGAAWNELVVEKPKIAGLFYDFSFGEASFDPNDEGYVAYGDMKDRIKAAEEDKKSFETRKEIEFKKMKKESEKINVPLYVFKNENNELKKYRVDAVPNPGYTEESLKNELIPKSKEILARNNNNYFSQEFQEFNKEAQTKLRILKGEEYHFVPVTAKQIYESKREISSEEKKKLISEIKEKNVFKGKVENEVSKKFQES